jgi:hypothetical protein
MLDHFINVNIIFLSCEKIQLSKRISKFTSQKFYEIDHWKDSPLKFFGVNLINTLRKISHHITINIYM